MADMRLIDVMHLGRRHVIGAWLVGDVLIDPGPTSCLDTLLEGLIDALSILDEDAVHVVVRVSFHDFPWCVMAVQTSPS